MNTKQKRSRLQALYFPTQSELESIKADAKILEKEDEATLIERYNSAARLGMVGARRQCASVLTLGIALHEKIGDPLVFYKNGLLYCPCTAVRGEDGRLIKTAFTEW